MPERRPITGRLIAEAGGSGRVALQRGADFVTPYQEAGQTLLNYVRYRLPDNDGKHKPHSENNNQRLGEYMGGLRPNLFRWNDNYGGWVRTYGPLALTIEPVVGSYKGAEVREQTVKPAEYEIELPPEILAQLFGLPQELIEGKTLKQLIPEIPKPADLDLLKKNSVPSLHPQVVAMSVDPKVRIPFLYVVKAGLDTKQLAVPKNEYSFRPSSYDPFLSTKKPEPVDPADVALVFNTVLPSKDFILKLLDETSKDSEVLRYLLVECGLDTDGLIDARDAVETLYTEGWKLHYKKS